MSTETAVTTDTAGTFTFEGNGAAEAEAMLGVPNIGHIPRIDLDGLRQIRDIHSFHPLMEAYRSLRANLRFVADRPIRSLVVTSAVPNEGKSMTLANLAMVMAMAMALDGKRLVVVDADLRRPRLHELFKVDVSPGLADILRGTHTIEDVLRPTQVENLSIIPACVPTYNAAELLESAAMVKLLADLGASFDMVMLDSPPTLAVADAPVIASLTDGVLMVVGYGETKKASVAATMTVLRRAHANILGTVFNRIPGASSGYYYDKRYVPSDPAPKDGPV